MATAQDRFLPRFDVRERPKLLVRASPEGGDEAFRRLDFGRSRLVRMPPTASVALQLLASSRPGRVVDAQLGPPVINAEDTCIENKGGFA